MRADDIQTMKQMIEFIQLELSKKPFHHKQLNLYLPAPFFYKLIKLIKFCLRDADNEPDKDFEPTDKTKSFYVEINGTPTKVYKR